MNHTPIYISRDDHSRLRLLLVTALYSHANAALRKLGTELNRAVVVDPTALPADVVTMDATVQF